MKIIKWLSLVGVFLLLLPSVFAQEVVFIARASAAKVGIDDRFQIEFTVKNLNREIENFIPPDFEGLQVLSNPSQSFQSINGNVSISLVYLVKATKLGTLTIGPAIAQVGGQKIQSNSLTLEVVKGSLAPKQQPQRRQSRARAFDPFEDFDREIEEMMQRHNQIMQQFNQQNQQAFQQYQRQMQERALAAEELTDENLAKNIFIKVAVDKTTAYIGEQINVSYKLYTRVPMEMNLTQLPVLNGFWSQDYQLSGPQRPTLETVDGRDYQVFLLKKTALFPQEVGTLELDPALAEGRAGYNNKMIKLRSQPIKINVKPLPSENQPLSFTGGVGNFSISVKLDKDHFTTDDIAQLKVTVSGSGNFKLIGAPKIAFPNGLEVYDPQVVDSITSRTPTINGYKSFTYTIVPQSVGKFVIPAFEFSYYDTRTKSYKTLYSKELELNVAKGENNLAKNTLQTQADKELQPIITDKLQSAKSRSIWVNSTWYWLLHGMVILAIGILGVWHRYQEKIAANQVFYKQKKANKVAWKRLSKARKLLSQGNEQAFYEEISKALWLYLSDKLRIPFAQLSKGQITSQLAQKGVTEAIINDFEQIITECELALYSPSGGKQQQLKTMNQAADMIGSLEQQLKAVKAIV